MPRKLNLGSGPFPLDGYENIDIAEGRKAYPLADVSDNSCEEVRVSHLFEHFGKAQALDVLREWKRVLLPGGTLKISVPDFDKIVACYQGPDAGKLPVEAFLLGAQADENDFHKSIYNEGKLRGHLLTAGFLRVEPWQGKGDTSQNPVSLNLMARKPTEEQLAPKKVVACLSAPRFGLMDVFASWYETFSKKNIPMRIGGGAFWGQVLERTMTDAVKAGAEWLICCDYDTPANDAVLDELLYLLNSFEEFDAIAPVQQHRGADAPLFCIYENFEKRILRKQITREEFEKPLLPVHTAHFGLTVIRTSALKKMSHPWFLGIPNENGEWLDGRVDDDIYFWRKFYDCGNKLAIATHAVIGHVETGVMFPGADLGRPQWCTMSEYKKREWCPPDGSWQ